MKNYIEPQMEIIELEVCDVITTSPEVGEDQLPFG